MVLAGLLQLENSNFEGDAYEYGPNMASKSPTWTNISLTQVPHRPNTALHDRDLNTQALDLVLASIGTQHDDSVLYFAKISATAHLSFHDPR